MDFINDIYECINDVGDFIENMTYEEFLKDKKTNYAVLRCIEIIGEAAKHIPTEICDKAPDIKWNEIRGMRNRVIHEYFGVDYVIVWKTAREYLPELKAKVEALIKLVSG